ncbi:uncharacterized protein BXIN_1552 [Babesia sp. Xinjiang]|uniref:uncharacterized protein n=1 Tax=Babesia sp. Xinjiang TaxID=462227 RepID=UPI000A24DF9A|nr:uncharacterized protein BXIN_1552 [Babesia sp. Xinjiang]ORM42312.1 hypothetical protein BXIN_1552 [Babesia sp. Xinjiang]
MQQSFVAVKSACRQHIKSRRFSSIFEVIRERRCPHPERGKDACAVVPPRNEDSVTTERANKTTEANVKHLWKQLNILRSKPTGYTDIKQLRYLTARTLAVLSITREIFNRICLNFERNLKEGKFAHFLMLSNALERSDVKELSVHYSKLLEHYLRIPEDWTPSLVNSVLGILNRSMSTEFSELEGGRETHGCAVKDIPWIVYEQQNPQFVEVDRKSAWQNAPSVLTGDMILDMISAPFTRDEESSKKPKKLCTGLRRLLWRSNDQIHRTVLAPADLAKVKVLPVSVDIVRHKSLKECLEDFFDQHFDGRHPGVKRLHVRRQMREQRRQLYLLKAFDTSSTLNKVCLEKSNRRRVNNTFGKIKRMMRYSGSRHVPTTQYYINECRVIKRSFLRPYKTIANGDTDGGSNLTQTGTLGTVSKSCDDTRRDQLARICKSFSSWPVTLSYVSAASDTTNLGENHVLGSETARDVASNAQTTGTTFSPLFSPRHLEILRHLESHASRQTPIFVDNMIFMRPVTLSSLFSRKLKRKVRALERAHNENVMSHTVAYMLRNGFWKKEEKALYVRLPREQPLWRHLFTIITALHKLDFTSYELISRVIAILRRSKSLSIREIVHDNTVRGAKHVCAVLLGTIRKFGHLVSALSVMMARDGSGELASQFLEVAWSVELRNKLIR